ncbi:MAG: hypothetical protein RL711_145 [Bacteroidota bacterium]
MKKTVAIIGSGPAALMLAATLDESTFDISIYEQKKSLARKFLVAGDGGFNLTHSEAMETFITRYTPADFLKPFLQQFTNQDLRNWLLGLGIDTYVGSSKRVFPIASIKPAQVLQAIVFYLKNKKVQFFTQHTFQNWTSSNALQFESNNETVIVDADIVVFALGGSSWSVTGADGIWASIFAQKGIAIIPFQASNCAYEVAWPEALIAVLEGQALKNITTTIGDKTVHGELVITRFGIEGNAIYALSPEIRAQFFRKSSAVVYVDFKPSLSIVQLKQKLDKPYRSSWTAHVVDALHLSKPQINLLKGMLSKETFMQPDEIVKYIKRFPLTLRSCAPIEEAISTVGGIALTEVDAYGQLHKIPHQFAIGEMLDWDAPTGGYLLQACFSMGYALGKELGIRY